MDKCLKQCHVKFTGLISLFTFFLAWCMTTISYKGNVFWILGGGFLVISEIIYIWICRNIVERILIEQLKVINRYAVLFGIIIASTCFRYTTNVLIASSLLLGMSIVVTSLIAQINLRENILVSKEDIVSLIIKLKEKDKLIILLCILGVFAFEKHAFQFKWDGLLYYEAAKDINLFSISSLAQYGHISQMYSVMLKVADLIFGKVEVAMVIMNIAMMLIGVCGFYRLLKFIVNDKGEISYVLGTAVYGCSPYVLGMVNYFSLDYYLICLLPWCMYKGLKKQWIDFVLVSVLFCFTKETAIVIYALLCLGLLIIDFKSTKGSIKRKLLEIISRIYYYYMLFIGVCWLVIYKMLGPWSAGEGGFSINGGYIAEKLKVFGVLNFNWLLLLIICSGLIIKNKKKFEGLWYIPVLSITIGFLLFSTLFVTINHARYIDCGVFVLNVFAIVVLLNVRKRVVSNVMTVGLALLMLLSCYFTIDPISRSVFKTVDIGRAKMITTSFVGFGDSMIYNKQMFYMEESISKVISQAYENEYDIAMPVIGNSTYHFDGMQEVMLLEEGYVKRSLYCTQNGRRSVNRINDSKSIDFYSFAGDVEYKEIFENASNPIIFIYTDSFGEDICRDIKVKCNVIDEGIVSKKGYEIKTIIFN